ncbi:MAG: DUF1330 domain-containing protein [Chloroflexota bacterium]|nr:DUF1330 domain-containing protein [Chloroflexota bacterium]
MASVYFISSYDITDPHLYEQEYVPAVLRTLAAAGGELIVATGSARAIEGASPSQTVVLRFPSEQVFRDWYDGTDYAPLLELRLATTTKGSAALANEFTTGAAAS